MTSSNMISPSSIDMTTPNTLQASTNNYTDHTGIVQLNKDELFTLFELIELEVTKNACGVPEPTPKEYSQSLKTFFYKTIDSLSICLMDEGADSSLIEDLKDIEAHRHHLFQGGAAIYNHDTIQKLKIFNNQRTAVIKKLLASRNRS